MQEQFDFLKNFKAPQKKHFVLIQGKKVEVSLQEKLDIIRNGENNYVLENDIPKKIEIKIDRHRFPEMDNISSDPFWPTEQFIWKK